MKLYIRKAIHEMNFICDIITHIHTSISIGNKIFVMIFLSYNFVLPKLHE